MNIALVGYGKMGKAIEKILLERGHQVSFKISRSNAEDIKLINGENTDVAIEFTGPDSAYDNLQVLLGNRVRTVSGSTGWTSKLPEIENLCREQNSAMIWASNFSVGVNLFFEITTHLAQLMAPYVDYTATIEEIHHTQKKDAPSGTAITLAEKIMQADHRYKTWTLAPEEKENALRITAIRQDPAPGTHTIKYSSVIDDIEIRHTAHNREGFALGVVLAAEYLHKKTGIFTMKDVLFAK